MIADDALSSPAARSIADAEDAERRLLAEEAKAERRHRRQTERLAGERERYQRARSRYEHARAEAEATRLSLVEAQTARTAGPQPDGTSTSL